MRHAETDREIDRCFDVMAELRTHIRRESFVRAIRRMEAEGYRLAFIEAEGTVVAVAGYRVGTNLALGKKLYVDDLVTAGQARSRGHGAQLLRQLRELAVELGCDYLHLDSGTARAQAHKFYFRHGLSIAAYHFVEKLNGQS